MQIILFKSNTQLWIIGIIYEKFKEEMTERNLMVVENAFELYNNDYLGGICC